MTEVVIPLDIAKHRMLAALQEFDISLGDRAARVLSDERRLNIVEEAVPRTGMMQCRPAGLTIDDLKAMDMHIEDYAQRFGPHFIEPDNPGRDYAVIDFEYVYTKNSLLWLAHEVGHAVADDAQRQQGRTFRDFTPQQMEEQAYFVQSIVAAAVDPEFNKESAEGPPAATDRLSNTFNRQSQRLAAYTAFEQASLMSEQQREAFIVSLLGGDPPTQNPPQPQKMDHDVRPAGRNFIDSNLRNAVS